MGKVSHDQLFSHGSVIIHHGGAGTTASALHAGVPQIIVPHFGDQFLWAKEIRRLKTGVRIRRKRWPERITPAVNHIEESPTLAGRAKELADILATENGPNKAVQVLEELLVEAKVD